MLGRASVLVTLCGSLAGCAPGGSGGRDGGGALDGGRADAGRVADSGPMRCTSDPECDDGLPCTIDECVVGNVCRLDPIDARCAAGERCVVGRGCVMGSGTDCTTAADCDDGSYCNGVESCVRDMCIPDRSVDCNDGNPCTLDACDDAVRGCRYDVAPGCDGGVITRDGGPGCDPFEPSDYSGTFSILPGQACDGTSDDYTVGSASFSVSGGALTVVVGRFTLRQSPAPTGPEFDVSGMDGCASVRLMGRFECDVRFRATWTATHTGGCRNCGTTTAIVAGRR